VTAARHRYLFLLASQCACPPPVTDGLRRADFRALAAGLDEMITAAGDGEVTEEL